MKYDKYILPMNMNQQPFIFTNTKGVTYFSYMRKPDRRIARGLDGICMDPDDDPPRIYIRPGMSDRREMNTQIHEVAHAFFWDKPEIDIRRYADTVSRYLHEAGWRKVAEPKVHGPLNEKSYHKAKKGKNKK